MTCPACERDQGGDARGRCAECGWKLEGPLTQILIELRKISQGADAEKCFPAIESYIRQSTLDSEIGDMIGVLVKAGNSDGATRLLIEAGQKRKRNWSGGLLALITGLVSFGVFSGLFQLVGVPFSEAEGAHIAFFGLGALFCGISSIGFRNPASILGGSTTGTQLSPQQWTTCHSSSNTGGYAWAVVMLMAGLAISGFGLFMGAIL